MNYQSQKKHFRSQALPTEPGNEQREFALSLTVMPNILEIEYDKKD